jgi:DNA-binding transcriptional ArsR family regulator
MKASTERARIPAEVRIAAMRFRTLGNPIRLAIVSELGAESRCVHELVDRLDTAQPLISQHLRVLRGARLVRTERRGKEVVYTLNDDHMSHIALDAIRRARQEDPK